jgi:hypothetical protein
MLSKESSRYLDLFKYHHGMVNTAWISGVVHNINQQRTECLVQQHPNPNLMLPIKTRKGDSIPGWVSEGDVYTFICRIEGSHLVDLGERVAEMYILKVEHPDVLVLPPSDVWELSSPKGAPRAEGKSLPRSNLKFSGTSNIIHLAGYVGAMKLIKPRLVRDTRPGAEPDAMRRDEGGLIVMLQQTVNPDRAIPVRMSGNKIEAYAQGLKRGVPLFVSEGMYRVRVKTIRETVDGVETETIQRLPYIQVKKFQGANKSQIIAKPEWIKELEADEPQRRRPLPAEKPAEHGDNAEALGLSEEALAALAEA